MSWTPFIRTHLVQKQNYFGPQVYSYPKLCMSWTPVIRTHLVQKQNRFGPQLLSYPRVCMPWTPVIRTHLVQKQNSFGPQVLSYPRVCMPWTPVIRTHLVQKQNSFGPQVLSYPRVCMPWTPVIRTHLVQKQTSFGQQVFYYPKLCMSWTPATELTWSRSRPHLVNRYSTIQNYACPGLQLQNSPGPEADLIWSTGNLLSKNYEYPEAIFLYEIQTKSLRRFPPCYSQPPLQLCLEISISSNSCNLLQFLEYNSCTLQRRKRENLIENHTPFPMV
jgi:hypothetical protein